MSSPPREIWHLKTEHIGQRVLVFESVSSTNDIAGELAQDPANFGCVVIAEHQQAGRGQYGRVWQSRTGDSLLMSVLLAPRPDLRRPVVLTAWAAVAVAEAVRELAGIQARLKWPNDLLIQGKKVSGILIEQGHGTVIGIGLNLNQSRDDFTNAGLPDATSMAMAAERLIDPRLAAETVIQQLDREYSRLLEGEMVPLEADWKWRVGLLGRPVIAELNDGSRTIGRLKELAFDGVVIDEGEAGVHVLRPEQIRHLRPA